MVGWGDCDCGVVGIGVCGVLGSVGKAVLVGLVLLGPVS